MGGFGAALGFVQRLFPPSRPWRLERMGYGWVWKGWATPGLRFPDLVGLR